MRTSRHVKTVGRLAAVAALAAGTVVAMQPTASAADAHVCVAQDSDTLDHLVNINGSEVQIGRGQCAGGVDAVYASSVCNQGTFWFGSDGSRGVYPHAGWFATSGLALTISCKTNLD